MAFANLIVRISGDIAPLDKATKQAIERVKSLGSGLTSVGSSLAVGISAPLAALGGIALKSAGDIEALKLGLISVAGGAKQAEAQFKQLREVAKLPGLGLQEAVQGSINLQALGFSADKSRNLLLQFGNALATVGRGREDLNEVIRQLGQLGARGQVTADNLKPIIERVPQVASIIREKFGPDALGNPAETFKKLGISSQQFIAIIEAELGKLPRVTGGIKNDFENLQDSITIAFAKAGEVVAPFAKQFIDGFAVPTLDKIQELSDGFKSLPEPVKAVTVGLGAFAAVAPLVVAGVGSMLGNLATITETLTKVGGAAGLAKLALAALPKVTIISIAVVGSLVFLDKFKEKLDQLRSEWKNDPFLNRLRDQWVEMTGAMQNLASSATPTIKAAVDIAKGFGVTLDPLKRFSETITEQGKASKEAAKRAQEYVKAQNDVYFAQARETVTSKLLAEERRILLQQQEENIKLVAEWRLRGGFIDDSEIKNIREATVATKDLGKEIDSIALIGRNASDALKGAIRPIDFGIEVFRPKGGTIDLERQAKTSQKTYEDSLKGAEKASKQFERQISTVATDLSRNLVDLLTKGGKLGDIMKNVFADIGKALLRSALEAQFKRIIGLVVDLASKIPGLAKGISSIFGIGGAAASTASTAASAANTASSAASAAGGVASAAGGAASSIAGAAGSSVTGIVGAVAGVVSAVSSVISNFQFAAMNKSLDLIEKETRYSQIHLSYILGKVNEHLPYLNLIHDRLATIVTQGIGVYNAPSDAGLRLQGGGSGVTVNINNPTFGAGTDQDSITSMFREAARQVQLAGAA